MPPQITSGDGCSKDDRLYPFVQTRSARILGPERVELRGGIWTCVGRDETGEILRNDWAAETTALSYYYEWGPTRRYGSRSQTLRTVMDPDTRIRSAIAALLPTGLVPGLRYHFRIVARSDRYPDRGWRRGASLTFRVPNRSAEDRRCSNPRIARATPARLRPGDTLTVTGTGLGRSGTLRIGSRAAETVRWTPTRIVAVVPARVAGRPKLAAVCGGNVSSARTPGAKAVRVTAR